MKEFQFEIDGVGRGGQTSRVITGRATAGGLLAALSDTARWFGDIKFTKSQLSTLKTLPAGGVLIKALENSGSWHFQVLIERVR